MHHRELYTVRRQKKKLINLFKKCTSPTNQTANSSKEMLTLIFTTKKASKCVLVCVILYSSENHEFMINLYDVLLLKFLVLYFSFVNGTPTMRRASTQSPTYSYGWWVIFSIWWNPFPKLWDQYLFQPIIKSVRKSMLVCTTSTSLPTIVITYFW